MYCAVKADIGQAKISNGGTGHPFLASVWRTDGPDSDPDS